MIIEQGAYDYGPRERYIERRHYYYDHGPHGGVYSAPGFVAPGISVGIYDDRW